MRVLCNPCLAPWPSPGVAAPARPGSRALAPSCRPWSSPRPWTAAARACSQVRRRNVQLAAWRFQPPKLENLETAVGDGVSLVAFALYKQIASIVLSPSFPGWFAPIKANPLRFVEFVSFAATLVSSWLLATYLTGGYSRSATRDLPATLTSTSLAWLVAMPVAAAQLVLTAAAESHALVATEGFASKLPLAASGPGEPFATAAGVLGVMSIWRCFYTSYLDPWSRLEVMEQAAEFRRVLAQVVLFAACCTIVLQVSELLVGPDHAVEMAAELDPL